MSMIYRTGYYFGELPCDSFRSLLMFQMPRLPYGWKPIEKRGEFLKARSARHGTVWYIKKDGTPIRRIKP